MENKHLITIIAVLAVINVYLLFFRKEPYYNIKEQALAEQMTNDPKHVFTNQVVPATTNNNVTNDDLLDLFNNLIESVHSNGPPGGANVSVDQTKYDILFKDILVNSEKRNIEMYPNPNKYNLKLNLNLNNIYKAEMIEVYVPAATDNAVNIPGYGNRLYFSYTAGTRSTTAYITILAGTYLSPDAIAAELNRQFKIILNGSCVTKDNKGGIIVSYNKNLNRYFFSDVNYTTLRTIIIYPTNGYSINFDFVVEDSICPYLMLNYEGPVIYSPYMSGPMTISTDENGLFVDIATNYGQYLDPSGNVQNVPTDVEPNLSNSIVSGLVLTNDRLFLSLGILNGQTYNIITNQNSNKNGNLSNIFCQVPNNTCISSSSVKTMLNQPSVYSAIQFYNPPLHKLNSLHIAWYKEDGELLRILDHSFTIRIYYYQKRLVGTEFSIPIP